MKTSRATFRSLVAFAFLLVLATAADAQAFRTWVAGDGNDANLCTRAAPCQTFAAAILQTRVGGEINAKSAGEFGPMFISKSLTIDGGGVFSGINVGGGVSHVVVNDAASPTPNTAVVTLRNLSINGAGETLGLTGVSFSSGKTLNIETYSIVLGPDIRDHIGNLWQEDGNAVHFRPRRAGGVQGILAEWTSTRFAAAGASHVPRRLTLVSRLMPRNANATPSAALTLQLYDSSAGQWANVATRILASDEFFHSLVIEIPDPERFAVSGSEPLRWRIGLRGEEWRDWDVDLMEMEVEEMP